MKKHFAALLIIIFGLITSQNLLQAQSIELLGGSTLNGAMNGVLLGGATMALQNSNDDFRPVEVGLGAGTLYGIGAGAYDMSQIDKGEQFYISGTFNDGTNRSILVLLDTIYGATGGMLIGSSVTLIVKERIGKGLQYGAGAGAWLGFGFGLIDAYALSKKPNNLQASSTNATRSVGGLLTYSNAKQSVEIGMINPEIMEQKQLSSTQFQKSYNATVNLVELQVNL